LPTIINNKYFIDGATLLPNSGKEKKKTKKVPEENRSFRRKTSDAAHLIYKRNTLAMAESAADCDDNLLSD